MSLLIIGKERLTKRVADVGYAPRFLSFFLALSFSRFDWASTLLHIRSSHRPFGHQEIIGGKNDQ